MNRQGALAAVIPLRPLARGSVSYETDHPTTAQYEAFAKVCSHFCEQLFDNRLSKPMLVFNQGLALASFFAADRWFAADDKARLVSEVDLNPDKLESLSAQDIAATLVHELTHLWQHELGEKKSRSGYHNKEWSRKMESSGLMPSQTGAPNGARVGQTMSQYVVPGGTFEKAFDSMPREWLLPFLPDAETTPKAFDSMPREWLLPFLPDAEMTPKKDRSKSKFVCPSCGDIARGKPSLEIDCRKCRKRGSPSAFLLETDAKGDSCGHEVSD